MSGPAAGGAQASTNAGKGGAGAGGAQTMEFVDANGNGIDDRYEGMGSGGAGKGGTGTGGFYPGFDNFISNGFDTGSGNRTRTAGTGGTSTNQDWITGGEPGSTTGGPGAGTDPVMAQTVPDGPNIFDQSAGYMNQAQQYLSDNLGFNPMMINPTVIDPSQYQQVTATQAQLGNLGRAATAFAQNAQLGNLDPAMLAQLGNLGDAAQMQASQLGDASQTVAELLRDQDLSAYMNPYTQNVIDNTMSRLGDAREQALNSTGAAATAGGAFGGDRHAIMEAQNNADYMRQVADTSGALNQQNFLNAQNMALQDVGALNRADLANMAANNQFALQQALMNQQANQFNTGQQNQFSLADFAAQNAMNQFNTGQQNQFSLADFAAQNAMNQFNTGQANQVGMFNAGQANANNLARFQAQNAMNQFNASAADRAALYNAQNYNNALNQNAAYEMQAQLANQGADFTAQNINNAMAGQLFNQGMQGFGLGNQANQNLLQAGGVIDAINNMYLQQGQGMFQNQMMSPLNQLGAYLSALQGGQMGQGTTTQTYNPGMFDYLQMGAGLGSSYLGGKGSDIRLKENIEPFMTINGVKLYTWEWNDKAHDIGVDDQPAIGVIADELMQTHPDAVSAGEDGYLRVDYTRVPELTEGLQ